MYVSPCTPWLSVLLKLPRNLPWEFRQPLIGCSRDTSFSCLAGITASTKRKWWSSANRTRDSCSSGGPYVTLCRTESLFDIVMHYLLQISTWLTGDLCKAVSFLMHMDGSVSGHVLVYMKAKAVCSPVTHHHASVLYIIHENKTTYIQAMWTHVKQVK